MQFDKAFMNTLISSLIAFRNEEDGQDLVEYSLLISAMSLAAIGLISGMGLNVKTVWTKIDTALNTVTVAGS